MQKLFLFYQINCPTSMVGIVLSMILVLLPCLVLAVLRDTNFLTKLS